ncbi:MAG: hypothetical protein MUF87_17370 [Anaerolineae bacterium]|jgi:hypothetical protein|nr:hypothetical protein [Anaerolineae bacterium]
MNNRKFCLGLCFTLFSLLSFSLVGRLTAQANITASLIYLKGDETAITELVVLVGEEQRTFVFSEIECFNLSPDQRYLALILKVNPNLQLIDLQTNQLRLWTPQQLRFSCPLVWSDARTLYHEGEQWDVLSAQRVVVPTPIPFSHRPPPNLATQSLRLFSSDQRKVVYNRCASEDLSIISADESVCNGESELIVYDLITQSVLFNLNDVTEAYFVATSYEDLPYVTVGIEWSPSGRYLIYRNAEIQTLVSVWDTLIPARLGIDAPLSTTALLDMAKFKGFEWTSTEDKVAFWVIDYERDGFNLAWFDLNQHIAQMTTQTFNPTSWQWFGNQAIAFIDETQQLVQLDIDTESITILDSGVIEILKP